MYSAAISTSKKKTARLSSLRMRGPILVEQTMNPIRAKAFNAKRSIKVVNCEKTSGIFFRKVTIQEISSISDYLFI